MLKRPTFWEKKFSGVSFFLFPLTFFYGLIQKWRWRTSTTRGIEARIKIICVGNFIAGGAGKTPTALYIAGELKKMGAAPFILTRGFGGKIKQATQVDLSCHTSLDVGDEAIMLAQHFPTIVGTDRPALAAYATQKGASCAVMDDGFQNPSLHKDLSVLVIDSYGLGNGRLLPSGPLREAPLAALARAQFVLSINTPPLSLLSSKPSLEGQLVVSTPPPLPEGAKVVAFAGIANPTKFFDTLTDCELPPLESHAFGDHHFYSEKQAAHLLARAESLDAVLITTEKDAARLQGATSPALCALSKKAYTLPVKLKIIRGADALHQKLQELYDDAKH